VGDLQASTRSRSKRRSTAGARRYRSRLTDPVTRKQKWKRPNALKHGVFSINPAIPGEDLREFEKSHAAVIDEWNPCDLTEEDLVFSIADAMWCKLRSQKFSRAKVIANSSDSRHPAFDETRGLVLFIGFMRHDPETAFDKCAVNFLRADKINYLKQKFPRSNYQSTSEWAEAVIEKLQSFLPPAAPKFDTLGLRKEIVVCLEALREATDDHQLFLSVIHASEFIEHDLNLRERLDARIARLIKQLIQIKAMKQMLRQTSTEREDEQTRKIAAGSNSEK
jgi:hypothetical protein